MRVVPRSRHGERDPGRGRVQSLELLFDPPSPPVLGVRGPGVDGQCLAPGIGRLLRFVEPVIDVPEIVERDGIARQLLFLAGPFSTRGNASLRRGPAWQAAGRGGRGRAVRPGTSRSACASSSACSRSAPLLDAELGEHGQGLGIVGRLAEDALDPGYRGIEITQLHVGGRQCQRDLPPQLDGRRWRCRVELLLQKLARRRTDAAERKPGR